MLRWLICWVGVLALWPPLGMSAETVTSAGVVELFTSQGCSDCPPADALLGELARVPGVVALSYHVTYWDELGWHDRFALARSDELQKYYATELQRSTLFTPQAIVDGKVSLIGADRRAILTALRVPHQAIPVALSLARGQMRVDLAARQLPAPVTVILIGYLPQATTAIGRGENGGRTLEEFNIVRSYDVLGLWRGDAKHFSAPLSSLPSEASHIAVLLQLPGGLMAGAATLAVR